MPNPNEDEERAAHYDKRSEQAMQAAVSIVQMVGDSDDTMNAILAQHTILQSFLLSDLVHEIKMLRKELCD